MRVVGSAYFWNSLLQTQWDATVVLTFTPSLLVYEGDDVVRVRCHTCEQVTPETNLSAYTYDTTRTRIDE